MGWQRHLLSCDWKYQAISQFLAVFVLFILQKNDLYRNKLKSLKVVKWKKDEWRMMKDEDFKLLKGFDYRQTNLTDICETEK